MFINTSRRLDQTGRRTHPLRSRGHEEEIELGTEFVSLEKYAKDAADYLRSQGIGRESDNSLII